MFNQKIRKSDKLFRLDLQLAGKKTLLINRVSLKYAEEHTYRTYREGFRKAAMVAAPGCRNAMEHHRIVTYVGDDNWLRNVLMLHQDMNGLKMVVQFEVDAYDSGTSNSDQSEELAASLQATTIQSPTSVQMNGLTIQKAGQEVPQTGLLELGTRWTQNRFQMDWSEVYTQLFLSQVPKHIVASQDNGIFTKIEERMLDADPELEAAKADAQTRMKKLVKVLDRIRELFMKEGKNSRLSLVCVYGTLRVYGRKSPESCLPHDLLELFK